MYIEDNQFGLTTEPKFIHFDLPKEGDNNLKHETVYIIKCNEFLDEHIPKNEIRQFLFKYKHGNIIHEQKKQ